MSMIPHLALPFSMDLVNGAPVVDQDSIDDVEQCVAVLCLTPIGSRAELPTYGIPDVTFEQSINTGPIVSAINTWEPRAAVTVTATPGPNATVSVGVSLAGGSE